MPDVRLPSGKVIKGVPEGTPKDEIMRKAIAAGLATEKDFGIQQSPPVQEAQQQPAQEEPSAFTQFMAKAPIFGGQTLPEVIGTGEAALAMGTNILTEPVAGIAGIAESLNPFAERGAGARAVEQVRGNAYEPSALGQKKLQDIGKLFQWVGDLQETGGKSGLASADMLIEGLGIEDPEIKATIRGIGGATGETLPAAIMELLGMKGIGRQGRAAERGFVEGDQVTQKGVDLFEREQPLSQSKIDTAIPIESASKSEPTRAAAEALGKGDLESAAAIADIDAGVLNAAEELGIEIPISSASQNKAFIEAAQSTKSLPNSELLAQEAAAMESAQRIANDLVSEIGRFASDSTGFDIALNKSMMNKVESIKSQESSAYNSIKSTIGNTDVDTTTMKRHLDEKLENLGGDASGLLSVEQKLYDLLKREEGTGRAPTYGRVDALRKEVGKGFDGKGVFKDEDYSALNEVYDVLTEAQEATIGGIDQSLLDAYQGAKRLTQQRKDIENSILNIFGKDAQSGALSAKINTAANQLVKGNIKNYNKLKNDIPKEFHQDLSALMLERIFSGRGIGKDGLGTGFAASWRELNARPTAKAAIYKDLPDGVAAKVEKIGKVWNALVRAKELQNTSKSARDIMAALDGGGFVKMLGIEAAKEVSPRGVAERVERSGLLSRASSVEKAEKLITSPKFSRAAKAYATNKDNAVNILTNSDAYKQWFDSLPANRQSEISRDGFWGWLARKGESATEAVQQPALIAAPAIDNQEQQQ